jgi:hypothetical protein
LATRIGRLEESSRQHWPTSDKRMNCVCVMPVRKRGAEFKRSTKNVMFDYVYLAVSKITTEGRRSR